MIAPGVWHQFGDKSQKQVIDQLRHGAGVGCILSPRDLALHKAKDYAPEYRGLGAQVLWDPQFHVPHLTTKLSKTYPTQALRASVSALTAITQPQLSELSRALEQVNGAIDATAVIAPAVVYEAGARASPAPR